LRFQESVRTENKKKSRTKKRKEKKRKEVRANLAKSLKQSCIQNLLF